MREGAAETCVRTGWMGVDKDRTHAAEIDGPLASAFARRIVDDFAVKVVVQKAHAVGELGELGERILQSPESGI